MLTDSLTVELDEEAGKIVQRLPVDIFYDSLYKLHGETFVSFVDRCFYLKAWKSIHGSYPYSLDYLKLRAIIVIEEEIGLRKAKEMFDMKQKQNRMEREIRAKQAQTQGPKF